MGVEYRHYLLPKPNSFTPRAEDVKSFVAKAAEARWISNRPPLLRGADGESPWSPDRPLPPGDWLLRWELNGAEKARYPLSPAPRGETYHAIEIHSATDYVYRASESIDPFESTLCECGAELEYDDDGDLFGGPFLAGRCPSCDRFIDPSEWMAAYRHPVTGEEQLLVGGATSRFAVVIDCGKCLPSEEEPAVADAGFLDLVQTVLRAPFYEVGDAC